MAGEKFDIVVFGATSFVGKILVRYMMQTYGLSGEVRWAVAGRSPVKMQALKDEWEGDADALEAIIADASDEAALRAMVARAKVVISTVGPYALYGEPLVKICAETGTDYVDLTGEVQWIRRMIRRYKDRAEASGARIVYACGFDSIPSDLGVHFLEREAVRQFGAPASQVKMGVKALRGGMSGGTAASLLNVMKEVAQEPELRKELQNPYSICPREHGFLAVQRNITRATYDKDFGRVLAPFIMAGINTRVVHRTNALRNKLYGTQFRYDEAMFAKSRFAATVMTLGLGLFMFLASFAPTRSFLARFVVPKPGEGPTPEQQEKGFYDLRFFGKTDAGDVIRTRVTGDRDPGYGSTAKMLAQAALCLARDIPKADVGGGFWTPATAMGDRLIDRLEKHAGLRFERIE